jgi:hypothetical protein
MRSRCAFAVLLSGVLLAMLPPISHAQDSDAKANPIEVRGCVKKGVEAGCLILTTSDNKSYSLHGNNLPTLDKGLVASVTGTPGGVDTCQQGTVLAVSSWSWTRMKCPKEPKEKSK